MKNQNQRVRTASAVACVSRPLMSQAKYRKKEFYRGAYYHVYNWGVNKDEIFLEDENFLYYITKLWQFKNKYKVDIIAYSLLDNHYHLLLK